MADLLNFNSNRKLEFDPSRPLTFDSRRPLEFDPRRNLAFIPNRDLGFGRRGVVFRGFICPICGALVTEDSVRCNECGTVFEGGRRAAGPPTGTPAATSAGREKPTRTAPTSPKTPAPKAGALYCARCGVKLKRGDAFCWNCGARASGSAEVIKLPQQRAESVTRDWRGPREP